MKSIKRLLIQLLRAVYLYPPEELKTSSTQEEWQIYYAKTTDISGLRMYYRSIREYSHCDKTPYVEDRIHAYTLKAADLERHIREGHNHSLFAGKCK